LKEHISGVIQRIGQEVWRIYMVDDAYRQSTGEFVQATNSDPRVRAIANPHNMCVGGATLNGFAAAIADGAFVIVKPDGDGQMDPTLIPPLIPPILDRTADFTKGNRFHHVSHVRSMPSLRLFGNAVLSFLTKLSTGYWGVFDPTNGLIAIDAKVAAGLPAEHISKRYFFESDLLFRLGSLRARVVDIPMKAVYGDEESGLSLLREISRFLSGHLKNLAKRILYGYFVRDFTIASVQLVLGALLIPFGAIFGVLNWHFEGQPASAGTVMLSAMPVIVGIQMLLGFLAYDVSNAPKAPISNYLE
jgi:hypothetical protein